MCVCVCLCVCVRTCAYVLVWYACMFGIMGYLRFRRFYGGGDDHKINYISARTVPSKAAAIMAGTRLSHFCHTQ